MNKESFEYITLFLDRFVHIGKVYYHLNETACIKKYMHLVSNQSLADILDNEQNNELEKITAINKMCYKELYSMTPSGRRKKQNKH